MPEDAHRGRRHRGPLAVSLAPQPFPGFHDAGIDPNRRVVHEERPVHLADIHVSDVSGGDDGDSLAKIERDVEIPGEVVERAEREDAKGRRRFPDARHDAAHRAVASGGNHDGRARAGPSSGVGRILPLEQFDDLRVAAGRVKELSDLAADSRPAHGCAGPGIDDDGDRGGQRHGHPHRRPSIRLVTSAALEETDV